MSGRVVQTRGAVSGNDRAEFVAQPLPDDVPAYPTCDHPSSEPRIRTLSNGAQQYVVQCLDCGKQVRALKRTDSDLRFDAELNDPFDPSIAEQFHGRWRTQYVAWNAQRTVTWQENYDAYLASNEWWRKRSLVLERDDFRCQARLDGCSDRAQEVHHLTYNHLFNEPLFDLISVCSSCHADITRMDRERRGTGG